MRARRASMATASIVSIGLVMTACGGGESGAKDAEGNGPDTIRIGVQSIPSALWILKEQNTLEEEYGYDIEWLDMSHAAAVLEAFAADSVDFAEAGVPPLMAGRDAGVEIVAIADTVGNVAGGVVAKDSGINDFADLRGKRIGFPGKSSWQYGLIQVALERGDLEESDVELVSVQFPDMIPLIEQGEIDAAFGQDPFMGHLVSTGEASMLIGAADLLESAKGEAVLAGHLVTSEAFLENHEEAARNIIKELAEVNKSIEADPPAAAGTWAEVFGGGIPVDSLEYSVKNDFTHFFQDVVPDRAYMQEYIEGTNDLGMTEIHDSEKFLDGYLNVELAKEATK